jgi:dihydroneopterin aldolase
MDTLHISDLKITTFIGVYAWEQAVQQTVILDLELAIDAKKTAANDDLASTLDYDAISKRLTEFLNNGRFQLIETLAERCANLLREEFNIPWLKLRVSKPAAIAHAKNVSVMIERGKN